MREYSPSQCLSSPSVFFIACIPGHSTNETCRTAKDMIRAFGSDVLEARSSTAYETAGVVEHPHAFDDPLVQRAADGMIAPWSICDKRSNWPFHQGEEIDVDGLCQGQTLASSFSGSLAVRPQIQSEAYRLDRTQKQPEAWRLDRKACLAQALRLQDVAQQKHQETLLEWCRRQREEADRFEAQRRAKEEEHARAAIEQSRKSIVADFLKQNGFRSATMPKRKMFKTTYPLHHAAALGDAQLIKMLLAERADVVQTNSSGRTAAQVANHMDRNGSHLDALRLLSVEEFGKCKESQDEHSDYKEV